MTKKVFVGILVGLLAMILAASFVLYRWKGRDWMRGRMQVVDVTGSWVGEDGRSLQITLHGPDVEAEANGRHMIFERDRDGKSFMEKIPETQANVTIGELHRMELTPEGTLRMSLARVDTQTAEIYRRKK